MKKKEQLELERAKTTGNFNILSLPLPKGVLLLYYFEENGNLVLFVIRRLHRALTVGHSLTHSLPKVGSQRSGEFSGRQLNERCGPPSPFKLFRLNQNSWLWYEMRSWSAHSSETNRTITARDFILLIVSTACDCPSTKLPRRILHSRNAFHAQISQRAISLRQSPAV